jgi:hypothetical protein
MSLHTPWSPNSFTDCAGRSAMHLFLASPCQPWARGYNVVQVAITKVHNEHPALCLHVGTVNILDNGFKSCTSSSRFQGRRHSHRLAACWHSFPVLDSPIFRKDVMIFLTIAVQLFHLTYKSPLVIQIPLHHLRIAGVVTEKTSYFRANQTANTRSVQRCMRLFRCRIC